MALISDLVSAIAKAEGMPEATVALAARYAREAGFLSQGARGRNAPHATVADCANLLIAVNASGCTVKDAPKAIENYRRLRIHAPHGSRDVRPSATVYSKIEHDKLRFLECRDGTFGEVLESIIDRFVGGELKSFMKDEASKYLGDEFLQKMVEEHRVDPKAAAAEVLRATDNMLQLGVVNFEICFYRPTPFARLTVERSIGGATESLAGATFVVTVEDVEAGRIMRGNGDRRDETAFGYRTFMSIAKAMRQ